MNISSTLAFSSDDLRTKNTGGTKDLKLMLASDWPSVKLIDEVNTYKTRMPYNPESNHSTISVKLISKHLQHHFKDLPKLEIRINGTLFAAINSFI